MPASANADAALAALRQRGAQGFDPVRYRFVESLARRSALHQGAARPLLDARLAAALKEFSEAFESARSAAGTLVNDLAAQFPDAADALGQLLQAGDFAGLRALAVRLRSQSHGTPLADLVRQLAGNGPGSRDGAGPALTPGDGPGELKSLTYFRRTWSRLSVDQSLSHALSQAPENAGPLNSHHLVLRALTLMRDISPEYVSRFMSHVETLLWLEQASSDGPPVKNAVGRETDNKPKPKRRRAG